MYGLQKVHKKDALIISSTISPTLANIFVSELENKIMDELKRKCIKSWIRYVDDTFVIFKDKNKISEVLNFLNIQH